jgi:uncharacterized membrane protein (UPF0127 family)
MIRNETRGAVLATSVRWATTPWTRFLGLMGRAQLPVGEALVFPGEKGVHTHFMRFPIDVVFYDRDGVVVDIAHALRPWRFSAYRRNAAGVIELPAGMARTTHTAVGDRLTIR